MYNNNIKPRQTTYSAPREIKASAHYAYIDRGITLDGSKFADGELLLEGTCLVMDDVTGKYEKYADGGTAENPVFPTGKSNPVILDESIKIPVDANGDNVDVTAGQVIVHGAVYESMLIGCTAAFKAATKGAILYR